MVNSSVSCLRLDLAQNKNVCNEPIWANRDREPATYCIRHEILGGKALNAKLKVKNLWESSTLV